MVRCETQWLSTLGFLDKLRTVCAMLAPSLRVSPSITPNKIKRVCGVCGVCTFLEYIYISTRLPLRLTKAALRLAKAN